MFSNNPFVPAALTRTPQGGYVPAGSTIQFQDNATPLMGNPNAYQGMLTRDLVRYTNGVQLENMNNGFSGLGTQFANGLQQLYDQGAYGGTYGQGGSRVFSPQSRNGYGGGWGEGSPFKIGSF